MKNKFRAWDKSIKYMDYRVRVTTTDDYIKVEVLDAFSDWRELEDGQYELMQSTGLHDKNGKEIFESDIVKVTDLDECTNCTDCGIGYVEYLDVFGFYNITEIENSIHELVFQGHTIEVMGNIYENPELLKVED